MLFCIVINSITIPVPDLAKNEASNSLSFIDWSQFVPSIIATFLGFGLALIGQWLWEHYKDKKNAKLLKKQFVSELIKIKGELGVMSGISVEPIKIPTWDICISTGDLKLLNSELQAELSYVYNVIEEINSWSLMQANYYFENNKLNDILEAELDRLKAILLDNDKKSIDNLLDILKGGG